MISSRSLSSSLNPDFSSNTTQESRAQQIVNAEIKSGINPVPVFKRAVLNNSKIAIKDALNGEKSYTELLTGSYKLSTQISDVCGKKKNKFNSSSILFIYNTYILSLKFTGKESLARVAFLCNNDISYIISQWATWISGQIGKKLIKINVNDIPKYLFTNISYHLLLS